MNISRYTSARGIAKEVNLPIETVLAEADAANLGKKGPHKNSPRTFDTVAALELKIRITKRKTEKLVAENNAILHKTHTAFQRMAGLRSLARAMGSHDEADILDLIAEELENLPVAPKAKALSDSTFASKYYAALHSSASFERLHTLSAELRKIQA